MLGELELLALSASMNLERIETLKLSSSDLPLGVLTEDMVIEG